MIQAFLLFMGIKRDKMIRAAICDDDNLIAHQIENMIWTTCNTEGIKVDAEVYYSDAALEKEVLNSQKFDIS